jgi:hypothetical protein
MLTLVELQERMAERTDEVTILEILNITSEDLVNAFVDRIEDRYDQLQEEYNE